MKNKVLYTIPFLFTAFACSGGVAYSGSTVRNANEAAMAAENFGQITAINGDQVTMVLGSMNTETFEGFEKGENFTGGKNRENFEFDVTEKGNGKVTEDFKIEKDQSNSGSDLDTESSATKKSNGSKGEFQAEVQEGTDGEFSFKERGPKGDMDFEMNEDFDPSNRPERPEMIEGEFEVREGNDGFKMKGSMQQFVAGEETVTYSFANATITSGKSDAADLTVSDLKVGDIVEFELGVNNDVTSAIVLRGGKGNRGMKGDQAMNSDVQKPERSQTDKDAETDSQKPSKDTQKAENNSGNNKEENKTVSSDKVTDEV